MASGGSPFDEYKARNSDYKPKSNRKPPRYGTSFEAELSLNSELQRSENEERSSLPNNLSWTGGEGARAKKSSRNKYSPAGDQYSDGSPTRFTRKKHTPATLPRTKFSSTASGAAQHRAMDKLKQHLTFPSEDEMQRGDEQRARQTARGDIPVNNEKNLYQQTSSRGTPLRNQENGSGVNHLQLANTTNSSNPAAADSSKVVDRLKEVRGYLKKATSLYITLSSKSSSPDEATDEDLEQLEKLAKLIRDLKAQEKAYVDFVQRSIAAAHGESSIDNTPSTSVVSLDGETQDDAVSEQSEDLEGLRQQHALLRQMVEQQKQLKELQDRQNALLDLQRHAENQLKEAEAEGRRISSLMNGQTVDTESVSGRSRSGTERSDESHSSQPGAVGGAINLRGSSTAGVPVRYTSREQAQPNRKPSNEQKPENFKNRRLPSSEQAALVSESTGSLTPDNEAQALAAADAAQERLELESKLMDLQAKKEQMDALVEQLQNLREMQLGKEMAQSQERSVNETIENGDDDVPLATRSAKDTGDNVDDEKILEALQLHRKLRKLQDVRDKLEKLKELFEEQQEAESDTAARGPQRAQESRDSQGAEASGADPADDAATLDDMPPGSIDWILSSGIDDPELLAKLRQVKAAKERVANLKQRNEQNNVVHPYSRAEAAASLAQAVAADDEDSTAQTDNETTGSISSSLMWQEDPEFQEKLKKLNAARKKLKKLQELVKKTEELPVGPNGRPYLPAEIVEMSFSTDDEEEEDDDSTAEGDPGRSAGRDANDESEEDATSETLVQEEDSRAHRERQDDDSELGYMDELTQQRAALSHLLAEKQKLLETQEQLKRLRHNDVMTQTRPSDKHKPLDTFIHNATEASTSRQGATADSATQTLVASEQRRDKYPQPGTSASNSLLWRELRRQRELQEQKLKKRKERLMLERKGRRSGLENGSEDEGFGRSTLSADITTATWGGSTQMSSTQNDSAVSEGSSQDSDEEILVEVEDDASDGIVQAEEEEEANSEVDIFPTSSTANPRQFRKRGKKQNASEKRLLFEGLRKQDLERHERFKGWQNSLFPSGNKKSAKKPQRFSNPEEFGEEERQSARERSMWERQFNVLQGQLDNTTSLCNTLLRDQQTLISVLLNRGETPQPSTLGPHSFNQYQQRQQEALQGIQNYFEQQRFLVQQQQMLQNLTECYSQMQQQHEDMLHLQQSFTQLFTQSASASAEETPSARPSATPNAPSSTMGNSHTPNSFSFQPSASFSYRPEASVRETPPPSPFSSTQARPAAQRHASAADASTSQQPYSFVSFPWLPGLRNRQFQFVGSTNPDTGVPSPEARTSQAYHQAGPVKPVSARVVTATNTSTGSHSLAYDPVAYSDSKASGSSNVVVGKQFPTPLRAAAAAQLAEQDKSNSWRAGAKRRREEDKIETDSISSHQSSLPGDSEKPGTESDAQSDYSLFEALRDSIYAEVATLISQNESRPHFLIELFRELQLLGSDYLRQRALYSLRDLVTRFLKDDPPGGTIESAMGAYSWLASASEQTPSESAGFSETDQDQDKMKVPEVSTQGIYDYVEAVESGSTLSTPNSANHEPFASEFLGETVIHLDKALKSMRERERRESECSGNEGAVAGTLQGDEPASSAGDVASESSLPDIQYPKIDTQALDRQIKKIMAEVIPCLNDHMEDTCSVELLEYIRKMVMGMIQQKNEGKEFSRFFHKQLESILQDSLAKFIGKRMKDCGEDLLVDISEILFNELAFYKLMQELDGGAKEKFFNREQKYWMGNIAARNSPTQADNTTETSRNTAEVKDDDEVGDENGENQEGSSGSSDWQVVDEAPEDKDDNMMSREQLERDEETLGRDRDDAMAEEFDEPGNQAEAADTESSQCINVVELSMSESRPLASNGSDEEEESEVEIEGAGDVDESEENAEGAVWIGSMNGSQGAHHNMLSSQMAAANGAGAEEDEEGASGSNQNKQEEDQDDDLPTKFTGLTEADLQVKIAEEQSRNDGIHGVVVAMNDGEELAGDPNAIPEPEGSALVNGDVHEPEN